MTMIWWYQIGLKLGQEETEIKTEEEEEMDDNTDRAAEKRQGTTE